MKSSRTATAIVLSASLVAGLAFAVPSTGIADDQMAAEALENVPAQATTNEAAVPKSAATDTYIEDTAATTQTTLYDATFIDDYCYEQLVERIPAIDAETNTLKGGWYVLLDNVELSKTLVVEGDVHVILIGDYTLSALEGIRVTKDSKLTLHTQAGATTKVLVRKGVLRVLTEEQRAEEEQMIALALEADPEYKHKEPQILFVEPCYEVVAGDNEPSTDPNHEFDSDHDPKPIDKPVFANKLLSRDYLEIYPRSSHRMSEQDGELVVKDEHLSCDRCGGWFEDVDGHFVVAKTDEEKAAFVAALKAQDGQEGEETLVVPEAESGDAVTITFDANGGAGSMDPLVIAAGESFELPECAFEPPEGMVFSQWSLGKPGSSVSVPTSTTVRAWWKTSTTGDDGSQSSQPEQMQDSGGDQIEAAPLQVSSDSQTSQQVSAQPTQPTQQSASTAQSSSPSTGDPQVSSSMIAFMLTIGSAISASGHWLRKDQSNQ